MAEVLHHDNHGHDGHHEHDDTDLTVFGFWTYLMSDLILFGSLFIAFAVLSSHVPAGTPSAYDLFHDSLGFVLTETFALLISSVTFGFAVLASYKKNVNQVITWLFITFLLVHRSLEWKSMNSITLYMKATVQLTVHSYHRSLLWLVHTVST